MYFYSPQTRFPEADISRNASKGLFAVGITASDHEAFSKICGEKPVSVTVPSLDAVSAPDAFAVAVVSQAFAPLLTEALEHLGNELRHNHETIIILLPRSSAPAIGIRNDGVANSFICTSDIFRRICNIAPIKDPDSLLFYLVADLLNGNITECKRILIRQLPLSMEVVQPLPENKIDVVMPHRGVSEHLDAALRNLSKEANDGGLFIHVGLDI